MEVEAAAQPTGWRVVPWAVWLLLVIAGLIVVRSAAAGTFLSLGLATFVAPVLFAAAVIYVAPQDKRFTWAALAMAATPAVTILAAWLPDAWFTLAPGDWKNAAPSLSDLGGLAAQFARLAGLVGLVLFGVALGGVRTFMSALIIGFAALVAGLTTIWFNATSIADLPILDLASSIGFSLINIVGWAFVFAAALESLRTWTLVGSGLVLANVVMNALLLWWHPATSDAATAVYLVISIPELIGWVVLIYAVLRGELTGPAPSRSRAARGSASPRRAG